MKNKKQTKSVRLPTHFRPMRYKIMLHPNLEKFTFRGEETVEFSLLKSTRLISLHADELKIELAEIVCESERQKAVKISYDKRTERVSFFFPHPIPVGKGELRLAFHGTLNNRMRGFYRSRYDIGGKEHHMAVTQFESTDARRAFPCVDEPAAKAVFDVTLMIPKGHTAISNTIPVEVREHDAGVEVVKFEPTPRMSTYLFAFIVGKVGYVEKKTKEGTSVRVFVTPGKKKQAAFALDVGVRVLEFYEKYFAIKYPLPVLDMIAVPDFSAGAMENWGAITYRETAILFDKNHSSTANKQWVALVIAHEIAHQWFGNLVTMSWWTHLWLNEGFASYIEYLAVDHIFHKWDVWTQFVYFDLGTALSLDALANTHPIEIEVGHPSEISEIFDAVSYSKGASVIRMLADYLGEKAFCDGLRHYLKKHQYANASTVDLWRAFEHVSGKPVAQIMQNWTARSGYPLIRVSETKKGILLRQRRFFSSPRHRAKMRDDTIWRVPINYRRETKNKSAWLLLGRKSQLVPLRLKPHEWVSFNAGASGVYRVDYPARLLAELQEAVIKKTLSARDRLSIQSDAFALAETGELAADKALALARAYKNETDYTVWVDLAASLGRLESVLADEKFFHQYRVYLKDIFSAVAGRVGWVPKKNESHTDTLLRPLALYSFGLAGDAATIRKANELFRKIQKGGAHVNPDIRGVVYGLVAEHGGAKEYAWFMWRHREEHLHEEKNRLLRALARFHDPKLLVRTLDYGFSKHVRAQDTPMVVSTVGANHKGTELAWRYVKAHWGEILSRYGAGGHALPHFIRPVGRFTTKEKADDVRRFFRAHKAPGAERAVKQTIERIESNLDWLKRDGAQIRDWLAREFPSKMKS